MVLYGYWYSGTAAEGKVVKQMKVPVGGKGIGMGKGMQVTARKGELWCVWVAECRIGVSNRTLTAMERKYQIVVHNVPHHQEFYCRVHS